MDGGPAGWSRIPALKEGEKIKISLTKKIHHGDEAPSSGAHAASTCGNAVNVKSGGGLLLRPPPPPGSTVHFGGAAPATAAPAAGETAAPAASAAVSADEEEWGDFN